MNKISNQFLLEKVLGWRHGKFTIFVDNLQVDYDWQMPDGTPVLDLSFTPVYSDASYIDAIAAILEDQELYLKIEGNVVSIGEILTGNILHSLYNGKCIINSIWDLTIAALGLTDEVDGVK